MKSLLIKLGCCALAFSSLVSCTVCGEKGGAISQTATRVVDTVNEWGCITSPRPQWRPAYGSKNADYLLACGCNNKPAPAKWCRLETP